MPYTTGIRKNLRRQSHYPVWCRNYYWDTMSLFGDKIFTRRLILRKIQEIDIPIIVAWSQSKIACGEYLNPGKHDMEQMRQQVRSSVFWSNTFFMRYFISDLYTLLMYYLLPFALSVHFIRLPPVPFVERHYPFQLPRNFHFILCQFFSLPRWPSIQSIRGKVLEKSL